MPGIHRVTDIESGHECWPPRPALTGTTTVFVNKLPATLSGVTVYPVHSCGPLAHSGILAEGSSTVFMNGSPVGRLGDKISCGGVALLCSTDVFAN